MDGNRLGENMRICSKTGLRSTSVISALKVGRAGQKLKIA